MKLSHFFLPHPDTHKKAHLLSFPALLVYIALFGILQFGIKGLSVIRPDILGVSTNVAVPELIKLTNTQRQQNGLHPLVENSELDAAAAAKAQNMFAENYWAHYSPSGKDPWGFIQSAGYKFSYAGENLAKNFQTSDEVVQAWMNSPTHKENIVNDHYTDVGMAVAYGKLNGQDTVLVVQEFGTPVDYLAEKNPTTPPVTNQTGTTQAEAPAITALAQSVPSINPQPTITPQTLSVSEAGESGVAAVTSKVPLVDAFQLTKATSVGLLGFIGLLLAIDLIALRSRAVSRISSRHWSHFALMAVVASTIINSSGGSIL